MVARPKSYSTKELDDAPVSEGFAEQPAKDGSSERGDRRGSLLGSSGKRPRESGALDLQSGWIGVVRIDPTTSGETMVDVEFPSEAVGGADRNPNAPVHLTYDLILFDDQGELGRLPRSITRSQDWKFVGWCVNDGGDHYQPRLRLAYDKLTLNRPMVARAEADQIAAFAYHGASTEDLPRLEGPPMYDHWYGTPETGPISKPAEAPVRLQGFLGRSAGEPRPAARVIEYEPLGVGCGIGARQESLKLETAHGRFDLRCCGP